MHSAIETAGWVLVHFVWQGTIIALVAAAGLGLLRRATPDMRYAVALAALLVMLAAPALTGWLLVAHGGRLLAAPATARITSSAVVVSVAGTHDPAGRPRALEG